MSERLWPFFKQYLIRYRFYYLCGAFLLIFVDALELLYPQLLRQVTELATGERDSHAPLGFLHSFFAIGVCYFIVSLLQGLARYGWRWFIIRNSYKVGEDVRRDLIHSIFRKDGKFFDQNSVGKLMSYSTGDVESIRMAMGPGTLFLFDAWIMMIFVPAAMLWTDFELAWVSLLPFLVSFLVATSFQKQIEKRYGQAQAQFSEWSGVVQEIVSNIPLVKAYVSADSQLARVDALGRRWISMNLKLSIYEKVLGPFLEAMTGIGIVLLMWKFIAIGAPISKLGALIGLSRYLQRLSWPMTATGLAVGMWFRGKASARRILEMQNAPVELPSDGKDVITLSQSIEIQIRPFKLENILDIRNPICFRSGERVALVGPIGSGKSSILKALARQMAVPAGSILLNQKPIESYDLNSYRDVVGFLPQDPFVFSESPQMNLFVKDAAEADALLDELELSFLKSENWKNGNLYLGERGLKLSGGQKQRLAIARLWAHPRSVYLMDDPLSALDYKTSQGIQQTLWKKTEGKLLCFATHRLVWMEKFDRILVFQNGQVIETGSHLELLAQKGLYNHLYQKSLVAEDLGLYLEKGHA